MDADDEGEVKTVAQVPGFSSRVGEGTIPGDGKQEEVPEEEHVLFPQTCMYFPLPVILPQLLPESWLPDVPPFPPFHSQTSLCQYC